MKQNASQKSFLKMIKSKGAASFIKWKLSIKLGQLFSSGGTINNKQIVLTLGHWIIQDFWNKRNPLSLLQNTLSEVNFPAPGGG